LEEFVGYNQCYQKSPMDEIGGRVIAFHHNMAVAMQVFHGWAIVMSLGFREWRCCQMVCQTKAASTRRISQGSA